MSEVSDVRKVFEDSLRRIDELIEGMRAERDRIKGSFERRLEMVRFGQVDWQSFEEFFEEPCVVVRRGLMSDMLLLHGDLIFRSDGWSGRLKATTFSL